jgi:hypothetical protein
MEFIMEINKGKSEINWVIKMVNSVKSKEQLDTVLKCFLLWEIKHASKNSNHKINSVFKSEFWACYKNKESQFSFPENPMS